jgi:2-phospho-L-lactate guanylyltransferase
MLNGNPRLRREKLSGKDTAAWTVVIPVKGTVDAKSRLNASPVLATAIAMDTVSAALAVARVIVVTSPEVAPLFSMLGAKVIRDFGRGLNQAIAQGVAAAGDRPVAVLLGDLPGLTGTELSAALDQAASHPRAMVPDADGVGTVLLTAQRGAMHEPAFGGQSRKAHLAGGYVELSLPSWSGLRRDVDTADHLNELAAARRLGCRTAGVFGSSGLTASDSPLTSPTLHPIRSQLPSPAQRWSA